MNDVSVRIYEITMPALLPAEYIYFYKIGKVLHGQRIREYMSIIPPSDIFEIELSNENDYIDKLNEITKKFKFIKEIEMDFNCYYPRINWHRNMYHYRDEKQAIEFFEAGRFLMDKLHKITYTINPNPTNDNSYGHEIRTLLLLICMEVENNFISIFKENGYIKDRYNTNDFFKLNEILDLSEYEVTFELFTEYPTIKPFLGWNNTSPTQSLSWYDVYNKTKHCREDQFKEGNLKNVLYSMAGLIALLYSQFNLLKDDNALFKINGVKVKFPTKKPDKRYLSHPVETKWNKKKLFESNRFKCL